MQIIEKLILDRVEILNSSGILQIRKIKQKWVINGDQEILVEPNAGLWRTTVNPGQWDLANEIGVRSYADIAWTPEVIEAWQQHRSETINKHTSRDSSGS